MQRKIAEKLRNAPVKHTNSRKIDLTAFCKSQFRNALKPKRGHSHRSKPLLQQIKPNPIHCRNGLSGCFFVF